MFKKILILFLSLPFLFFNVKSVSAVDSVGITVSPPVFEITGNPGDVLENTIKVSNSSDIPVAIETDLRNFTAIGEEGAVGLTEEETSFSLVQWMKVSPDSFTIQPKDTKIFKFTIEVPVNAEPGGHFGSVVFKTGGNNVSGSGASVSQEIASLVLLELAGKVNEVASVLDFKSDSGFYEYGPVVFSSRVKNDGSIHLKPSGSVTITNTFGKQVAVLSVDGKNVLPGAVRKVSTTWDKKWTIGRFTATEVLVYGADKEQLIATTNFVVMPYKLVAIVFVIALIILVGLYKSRKRLKLALSVLLKSDLSAK